MTLQQLLFDETIDQVSLVKNCGSNDLSFAVFGAKVPDLEAISSKRGALCGSNLNAIKRVGDTINTVSLATAGVFLSKGTFREDSPYYKEYISNVLYILPTYHFIKELRRQLSGVVPPEDSKFSPTELAFYVEYQEWVDGDSKSDELLLALESLDTWLVDELIGSLHPQLIREYTPQHKWMKLEERT